MKQLGPEGVSETEEVRVIADWVMKGKPVYDEKGVLAGCSLHSKTSLRTSVQSIDEVTVCTPLDGSDPHILEATTVVPVSEGNLDMEFNSGRRPMTIAELRRHISIFDI